MLVGNIYDNGPITPIAKIHENLGIWTRGKWVYYDVKYIEPMPRNSTLVADMVAISGAVNIPANGTIAAQVIAALSLGDMELLHLRFYPIDDVEAILWEQESQLRFTWRGATARVNLLTSLFDPNLATTTFWIVGRDRDARIEVVNPLGVAQPQARLAFFGFRYILENLSADIEKDIREGRRFCTYLPAEGLQA